MAEIYSMNGCCGVKEIHGVSEMNTLRFGLPTLQGAKDPKQFLEPFLNRKALHYNAFAFFTEVESRNGGDRLKDYIQDCGLGEVITTSTRLNKNSGNKIRMYIWQIDHDKLDDYTKKHIGIDPRDRDTLLY